MPRTNFAIVVLLGIVAVAGAALSSMGFVSRPGALASGAIWIAYTAYWFYENRMGGEDEAPVAEEE